MLQGGKRLLRPFGVEERGRRFKLYRSNGAGRFIQCTMFSAEAKKFVLVFPEGRGALGGWSTLAVKLCSLIYSLLRG